MKNPLRYLSASLIPAALIACGGGGGGGGGVGVTLGNVDLKGTDAIANIETVSEPSVASAFLRGMVDFIGGNDALAASSNFTLTNYPASKKLKNGQLLDINIILEPVNDEDAENLTSIMNSCALGNPEISVERTRKLDFNGDMTLVDAIFPTAIHDDCSVDYDFGIFIISANGDAYRVDVDSIEGESLDFRNVQIIEANSPLVNTSDNPIVQIDFVPFWRVIELHPETRTISLEDLTPRTMELRNQRGLYNGEYFQVSNYMFKKGETAFDDSGPGGIQGEFLNENGEFVYATYRYIDEYKYRTAFDGFYIYNPADKSSTPVTANPEVKMGNMAYRYNTHYISDSGYHWDSETNELSCVFSELDSNTADCGTAGLLLGKFGNIVVYVEPISGVAYQYDIDTRELITLDASDLPYVFEYDFVNKPPVVLADAVYIEAVHSTTSDKRFLEFNFVTKKISDRGLLQDGGRQVTSFPAL